MFYLQFEGELIKLLKLLSCCLYRLKREGHFNRMSASVSFLIVNTLHYQYKEQSGNVY
jgi:hypothetical protein